MGSIAKFRKKQVGVLAAAIMATAYMPTAMALPTGEHNEKNVTISRNGDDMTVTLKENEKKGAVDWGRFDIPAGQTVNFKSFDGSKGWAVLNRVPNGPKSEIYGTLNGLGGTVFLVNPHGILFGEGARVEVGSLVASTLDIKQQDFMENTTTAYKFEQRTDIEGARITNLTNITAEDGVVALLAHQVVSGVVNVETDADGVYKSSDPLADMNTITAGQVAMAAGKNITLNLPYDNKISVEVEVPSDKADFVVNSSTIRANDGYVLMKASDANDLGGNLVCQTGNIDVTAKGMALDEAGNIVLEADKVIVGGTLNANVDIDADNVDIVKDIIKTSDIGVTTLDVNAANIINLNADITTGAVITEDAYGKFTYSSDGEALDVKLKADKIIVNDSGSSTPRKIITWGHDTTPNEVNTPGSVTIDGKVDSYDSVGVHGSLLVESGDVTITGKVGSDKTLHNLSVYSDGNITIEDDVKADNNVRAWTRDRSLNNWRGATASSAYFVMANDHVEGKDITVKAITAGNTVLLNAGNDVTINGKITGEAKNLTEEGGRDNSVVLIVAQGDFKNYAGDKAIEVPTDKENPENDKHWKVFSTSPVDDWFDGLDSKNYAEWGWGGEGFDSKAYDNIQERGGVWGSPHNYVTDANNRYIFKVKPSLIFKANDSEMTIGDPIPSLSYTGGLWAQSKKYTDTWKNLSLKEYTSAFQDGTKDYSLEDLKADLADFVDTTKAETYANGVTLVNTNYSPEDLLAKIPADCLDGVPEETRAGLLDGIRGQYPDGVPADELATAFARLLADSLAIDSDGIPDSVRTELRADLLKEVKARYNTAVPADDFFEVINDLLAEVRANHNDYYLKYGLPVRYESEIKNLKYENVKFLPGNFTVHPLESQAPPVTPKDTPSDTPVDTPDNPVNFADKPHMGTLTTSNLDGSASYTVAHNGTSADRILGLQTAELPVFNEKNGVVKLYATYDVTVAPDKVEMEATAKVLPEPEQAKNQYRELESELATENGSARFLLTYNGSTLDIYPTDEASQSLLVAGDGKKNEEIESKALYTAFNHMGIFLDDLDGVYTHFESVRG